MTRQKFTYAIAIVIAILLSILMLSGGAFSKRAAASAAVNAPSDVLDDLKKDSSFKVEDYPAVSDNYTIQLKQIAESTAGELLIYCYQPSGNAQGIKATSINIAQEPDDRPNLEFKGYSLTLQNYNGVFFKYIVNGFKVSSDSVRYYNISNILRPFNSDIDDPPAEGQTISEVSNKVGQLWTVSTQDGKINYAMLTSEVIEITTKHVGYCVYDDGATLGWGRAEGITKAYFVAFSTDRPIDRLISADLTFYATRAHCMICLNDSHKDHDMFYDFHDSEYIDFGTGVYNNEPLTIKHTQKFSNQGGGNLYRPANKYTWNRIRKTSEFIADNNNKDYKLTSSGSDSISDTQWVLNFYEAQDKYKINNVWLTFIPGISQIHGISDGECELNNVYDVQILRLEFETDGKTYNLGVVDNKQTGDNHTPDNTPIEKKSWWEKILDILKKLPWWAWVAIVCGVVVLCLFFRPFVKLMGFIFKGLWLIISAPFKLIAKLFKKKNK